MFEQDQKGFFRTLEAVEQREGEMPKMQRFVEFWGGIWEQNKPTLNMSWMEEVKAELGERANDQYDFLNIMISDVFCLRDIIGYNIVKISSNT